MVASAFFLQHPAGAVSLKVAPLEYRTSLTQGEKKKGFIDISNPSDQPMTVKTSAQAFRQIDDQGTIQFFDDEQISGGVQLDLDEFELGPKEAVRMYFLLDGTKLPAGDVFGAIFFTTSPSKATDGVGQSVRLGTILSVVNGTPGMRQAVITDLNLPQFSFTTELKGSYAIKNTADPDTATGFYPTVRLSAAPSGVAKEVAGKLVFAGRTRVNEFSYKLPPLGVYRIEARHGDSAQVRWVMVAHPTAIAAIIALLVAVGIVWRNARRRKNARFHS